MDKVREYFQDDEHKRQFEIWYKDKYGKEYEWRKKITMLEEKINVLSAGEHFSFKGFDWICLDPNAEEGNGVLAIMAETWNGKEYQFDEDGYNNYAKSSLRRKLQKELLPVLGEENLLPHVVDLTADNGDDLYGTVTDKVFIPSCDEYRKYRKHVPLLDEWIWTCTPWWIDPSAGNGGDVRGVITTGSLHNYFACYSHGVAPACVFSSENLKLRRQAQMVEA